jgi:L-threonylcarbamoyladenylate synthase
MTTIYKINPEKINLNSIKKCGELIKKGKLVVFPTETVYGLGANALDEKAVDKIFKAKGRPKDNPLIVHISDYKMLNPLVESIPEKAKKLMKKFWPGPLTIIFKKQGSVPDNVTCCLDTVAIRMPSNPIAKKLIEVSGVPIAAPSSNISGKPSCTSAKHAIEDMDGKVAAIIDGGGCEFGLESTVVDISKKIPVILRPGSITLEQLNKLLGKIVVADPNAKKPICPGMKYRHYAPNTPFILITGKNQKEMRLKTDQICSDFQERKKKAIIIGSRELSEELSKDPKMKIKVHIIGARKDLPYLAHYVFDVMRELDKKHYDYIIMGGVPEKGLGLAIMNRLKKAASEII